MSNLDPIQIERYALYLDNLIIIYIDKNNPDFYSLTYSEGETLKIPRSYQSNLESLLPQSFLPYSNMWINDSFIHYMDITWDIKNETYVLLTKLNKIGEIREFDTLVNLQSLVAQRIARSTGAIINNEQEINQAIQTQVTPVVSQLVEQQVTTVVGPVVNQSVSNALAQELDVSNLDTYFNSQLNAEG